MPAPTRRGGGVAAVGFDPLPITKETEGYNAKVVTRNVGVVAVLCAAFVIASLRLAPEPGKGGTHPPAGAARLLTAWMLAACATLTVADVTISARPYLDREKKQVTNTPLGSFIYLTFQGVSLQFVVYVSNALAETTLASHDCAATTRSSLCGVASRVLYATHAVAVFTATVACIVCILFFALVWFGPDFEVVRRFWDKHVGGFTEKMIRTHVVPFVLAIVDLMVVKRRGLLEKVPYNVVTVSLCYSAAYLALVNAVSAMNGGFFPYPFMRAYLGRNLLRWVVFYLAASGFNIVVFSILHAMSQSYHVWP